MIKECFAVFVLLNVVLEGSARWSVHIEETEYRDEVDYANEINSNEIKNVEDWKLFKEFQLEYEKTYESEIEQAARFKIFQENLRQIENLNAEKDDFATYGINQFSDLTSEELFGKGTGFNDSFYEEFDYNISSEEDLVPHNIPLEELFVSGKGVGDIAFDWRTKHKVTPVKNQGRCGSCWAFSACGVLESQYAIKHNHLVQLSEQQLLDCFGSCHGYNTLVVLRQAMKAGGVMFESSYKYQGKKMTCRFRKNQAGVHIKKVYDLSNYTEDKLKDFLKKHGPIAVSLNFNMLHHYKNGIAHPAGCPKQPNHAVLLVGYGIEGGQPFWTLKNSWGTRFGENGFFRIYRGDNVCGIRTRPSFAEIF